MVLPNHEEGREESQKDIQVRYFLSSRIYGNYDLPNTREAEWTMRHPIRYDHLTESYVCVLRYTTIETRKDGVKFTNRELSEASQHHVETENAYKAHLN